MSEAIPGTQQSAARFAPPASNGSGRSREAHPLPWSQFKALDVKREFVVDGGLLPLQGKMFIYGSPGVGKTYLALQLAASITKEVPFLDIFPIPQARRVLYLAAENSEGDLIVRVSKLEAAFRGLPDSFMLRVDFDMKLDSDDGEERLKAWVRENRIQVVIVDPVYKFFSGDENTMLGTQKFRDTVDRIMRDCNVSVVLIHHPTKGARSYSGDRYERGLDELRGAGWAAWADTVIRLDGEADGTERKVVFQKLRHAALRSPLPVQFDGRAAIFVVAELPPEDKLLQTLKDAGGRMLQSDLADAVRDYPGLTNVTRPLGDLEKAGKVRRRRATREEYPKPGPKPYMVELVGD